MYSVKRGYQMHKCNFCPAIEWEGGYFIQVKFATPKEEANLVDYKGGSYCYRYLCPNHAFIINYITNHFPQELKAKK